MIYRYQEKDSKTGIFRIMDDIIVNPYICQSITRHITEVLPVPPIEIFNKYDTTSFFTEKAVELFKEDLDRICQRFEYEGFEVEIISIECNPEDIKEFIIYEDEYQVLIKDSDMEVVSMDNCKYCDTNSNECKIWINCKTLDFYLFEKAAKEELDPTIITGIRYCPYCGRDLRGKKW